MNKVRKRINKLKKLSNRLRHSKMKYVFVAVFVLIGVATILYTRAATPTAHLEAESTTRSGVSVKADSAASNGQYLEFGSGSSAPTTPPDTSKPGAHNTGPTNPSILKTVGSMTITQEGAVIENVYITGSVKIQANNVTMRNFVVDGGLYGIQATYGYSGIVIEDGELKNASSASIYGTGFTARRLNMHDNNGDGLKVQGNSLPTVVEWSWWHHLGKADGAHADGNQSEGGDVNVVFRYNHCDMPNNSKGGPGLPYKANSCFLGLAMNKTIIENNWLNGGNYTVYCQPGTVVRNNKMGRGYNFGLRSGSCGTWTGNTWEDTGDPA